MTIPQHRVQVIFGHTVICQQTASKPDAAKYEAAMRRRFPSLRVENKVLPDQPPYQQTANLR